MKDIHAIILAGTIDFGRCKIASKTPVCLWPVLDKPAIIRILEWIQVSGIKSATICLDGDYSVIESEIKKCSLSLEIDYLTETLPWGTAGCVREVINKNDQADTFLVSKAAMLLPPSIPDLVNNHINSKKLLTVAINPAQKQMQSFYEATGAYVCSKEIIDYIPLLGYCDIKERLIPCMIQKKQQINAYLLENITGPFRDIESYFNSIQNSLTQLIASYKDQGRYTIKDSNILIAKTANISENAKIFGPVAIFDNVRIEDCIIFGPTIISQDSHIQSGTFIESSIVWENSIIGSKSEIRNCLVNNNTSVSTKLKKDREIISS